MTQCVVADETGTLKTSVADPCTGYVLLSPTEYASLNNSPLNLSAEDGAVLSLAIVGVWSAAYGFKVLIRALNVGDDGVSSST